MILLLHKVVRTLYFSGAVRQSVLMTVGTMATGVLMALAFIVVSRVLGPEQFGVLSVSLALMGLLMRVPDLGLGQVMLKMLGNWHGQDKKIEDFLSLILYWKGWLSGGLLLIGMLLIPWFQTLLNYPYPRILMVTVLGSILIGLYDYVHIILASRHQFFWVSVLSIAQAVLKTVGFLILLFMGLRDVFNLALVYYLAPVIAAAIVAWQFRSTLIFRPRPGSPVLRQEISRFALHAGLGTIFMTFISNVDILLVQRALSPTETGIYSGAGKVAVFVAFLSAAISGVLNNRVARYTDKVVLARYLKKSVIVVFAALLGFVCFLPFARLAILFTIGPEYVTGETALIVLVLNAFLSLAVVPYIAFFYAVNRPGYFSLAGFLQVLVIVLGNVLFLESHGIMAAAWSRVAASLALAGYTAWAIWHEMSTASDTSIMKKTS